MLSRREMMNDEIVSGQGKELNLHECKGSYLHGLHLYGHSTQETTTGAQLFDASKVSGHEEGGCTLENNGDGSFTLYGDGNLTRSFHIYGSYSHEESVELFPSGTYAMNQLDVYPYFFMRIRTSSADTKETNSNGNTSVTVTDEDVADENYTVEIGVYGFSGKQINPGSCYPMVSKGFVSLLYEPYTGGRLSPNPDYPQEIVNAGVPVPAGVNLFNADGIKDGFVNNANVGNAFYIGAEASFPDAQYYEIVLPEGTTQVSFDFSGVVNSGSETTPWRMRYSDDNGTCVSQNPWAQSMSGTHTLRNGTTKLYIVALYGFNENIKTSGMLNVGSTLLPWEPYYTYQIQVDVSGDSETVETQSIAIQISNGLPGIPVTSGGNYTDENGQQWICDEIDFARGKYIQRVKQIELDGSDDEKWNSSMQIIYIVISDAKANTLAKCSHFTNYKFTSGYSDGFCNNINKAFCFKWEGFEPIDNSDVVAWRTFLQSEPISIVYILNEPIETDLTAEQITQYKSLHTNTPTTIVSNDADAWMKAGYRRVRGKEGKEQ